MTLTQRQTTLAQRIPLALLIIALAGVAGALALYASTPRGNTGESHFDTLIVLGSPANSDGSPSPIERERVMEGVQEYRRGVAPRLIMTGGPAHNRYIEAEVMAQFARAQGVPADAVLEEKRAQDTIQNAFYSVRIMETHGWNSAEIVSSPSHLARASLIFEHFPIRYRTHASHDGNILYECAAYVREVEYTDRLRLFGFKPSPYLPQR